MKAFWKSTAFAVALMFALAGAARAQDDDQDCDNIQAELKKLAERLMNTSDPRASARRAATGQLLGIIKATTVLAECYEDGKKATTSC